MRDTRVRLTGLIPTPITGGAVIKRSFGSSLVSADTYGSADSGGRGSGMGVVPWRRAVLRSSRVFWSRMRATPSSDSSMDLTMRARHVSVCAKPLLFSLNAR